MAPCEANAFLAQHAALLIRSYRHWTSRDLVDPALSDVDAARALYEAPFVVLSHDAAVDPCFTYANRTAQRLFEMSWEQIFGLPSRYSAEPLAREERERLLTQVAMRGYTDDYSGVRISKTGKRFLIRRAAVWNLGDESGKACGQAACFGEWEPAIPLANT
jgi:hypothetical protein